MRSVILALAAVGLAGCNQVVSETPWFTAADAQNMPTMRPGLWISIRDEKCQVRESEPAERWPECADAAVIRSTDIVALVPDKLSFEPNGHAPKSAKEGRSSWLPQAYVLAAGDPRILQVFWGFGGGADPAANEPQTPKMNYLYSALTPTKLDEAGRIIAFEQWSVLCGPPPQRPKGQPQDAVTHAPFPGLKMDGNTCTASSVRTLRGAAKASEGIDSDRSKSHWVRGGYR